MGASMVRRLLKKGHDCVVYDIAAGGGRARCRRTARSAPRRSPSWSRRLARPRAIWMMVPAGDRRRRNSTQLVAAPRAGDIVIDGGNSYYRDDIRRAKELAAAGLHYVDVGTSGGIAGLERGYCLMIGGEADIVAHLTPIFAALAPGRRRGAAHARARAARRRAPSRAFCTAGRTAPGISSRWSTTASSTALMAAYAEGLNILRNANVGKRSTRSDAETTPLRNPEFYQYDMNLPEITEVWRRGSVIGSWLLDLTAGALLQDPQLRSVRRPRLRFRRRPLDDRGGDRRGGADARAERGAVRPLHVARRGRLRQPGAVGDAPRVRRPRRKARGAAR